MAEPLIVGSGPDDLFNALVEFFNVCCTALSTTPAGCPECSFVAEGPPPFDVLPSLMVWVGGPALGDTFALQPALAPGHRVAVMGEVNLISMTAAIIRCAASMDEEGDLPSAAEHTAVTRQINADLWAIWNHVRAAKRAGTLFAPKEREFFFDPGVAVNQNNGACGWQVTIRTQLPGYKVT